MNRKLLILLLFFIISETFYIFLLSFVFGYLVGYSYQYVTAKRGRNEIHHFFLSYNRKNGIAISTIRKPQFK